MILNSKAWYDKVEYYEKDVNPQDFINCEDEDELWESVKEVLESSGPIEEKLYDYDYEFALPDEFIVEWQKLKKSEKL